MTESLRALAGLLLIVLLGGGGTACAQGDRPPDASPALDQFDTDLSNAAIDLSTLRPGGPSKDGIPSIDDPSFVSIASARDWVASQEPVIVVERGGEGKAYPHSITEKRRVIHDTLAGRALVIFHAPDAVSALDAWQIKRSKEVGSTGIFDRRVNGRTLQFEYAEDGRFEDTATRSVWTVTGRAVEGPLKGTQLSRISHGDYFAFAWMAFRPDATLYNALGS